MNLQKIAIAACLGLALSACGPDLGPKKSSREEHSYDVQTVRHLKVAADSADIHIYPASGETGTVEFVKKRPQTPIGKVICDVDFSVDGDTMYVNMKSKASNGCEFDAKIALNRGSTIEVNGGSGNIKIEDMAAPTLKANVGSGNIELTNIASNVQAKSGSGDVKISLTKPEADDFENTVKATSGSGNIDAWFGFVAKKGSFEAKTGSGDIKLKIPGATRFTLDTDTGSGKVSKGVSATGDGMQVSLKTGSGNIQVVNNGL